MKENLGDVQAGLFQAGGGTGTLSKVLPAHRYCCSFIFKK
jgi:hypothetical protein